jgi:hypothetical protein
MGYVPYQSKNRPIWEIIPRRPRDLFDCCDQIIEMCDLCIAYDPLYGKSPAPAEASAGRASHRADGVPLEIPRPGKSFWRPGELDERRQPVPIKPMDVVSEGW